VGLGVKFIGVKAGGERTSEKPGERARTYDWGTLGGKAEVRSEEEQGQGGERGGGGVCLVLCRNLQSQSKMGILNGFIHTTIISCR